MQPKALLSPALANSWSRTLSNHGGMALGAAILAESETTRLTEPPTPPPPCFRSPLRRLRDIMK